MPFGFDDEDDIDNPFLSPQAKQDLMDRKEQEMKERDARGEFCMLCGPISHCTCEEGPGQEYSSSYREY